MAAENNDISFFQLFQYCLASGLGTIGDFSSKQLLHDQFPFVIGLLPLLTIDATIGNQAFSHDRCNIFPGLSCSKANNTSLNSVRKNTVEAQVEYTLKVMERAGVTCY